VVTVVLVKLAVIGMRIARLRNKKRPTRMILVPGRQVAAILLGLPCSMMFGWLTDSGPVRWLADWKVLHLGLERSPVLTGVQLLFLTIVVSWLVLSWLSRRFDAHVGPDRVAAMTAEAQATKAKRAEERLGVLPSVVAFLSPLGLFAVIIAFALHGPPRLPPVALSIGEVLSAALFFFAVGTSVFSARAWKPASSRPADRLG
jgi:hypothetical protein